MLNDSYNFFLITAAVYLILLILDNFLKFWYRSSRSLILQRTGIKIQLFQVKWFGTNFNRCIQKVGTWRTKFQKTWFTFGMWITLFSLPFAVFFIIQSTYALFVNLVWKDTKLERSTTPFLEPAVPGVNIPISDIGYYVLTLLICSVFHELGHATAAVREGIHITGVGLVILLIVPVAFVQMEGLEMLSSNKQLRVLCAGVWHNIILAFVAALVMFLLPWLCYPFYEYGNGIQVTSIHRNSPLQEEGGLKINDIILSINKCPVRDQDSWIKCIIQVARNPVSGYCVTSEFIHENDETVQVRQSQNLVECCDNDTLSKICFEYIEKRDNPLELPQYSCLKARNVVEQSKSACSSSDDCAGLHCFRPSLSNGTKLIEIRRRYENNVLFLGYPVEILHGVHISEFVKTTQLTSSIPNAISKFCSFMIMFSGALAALNLVPCFHFDGQHITRLIVNICLAKNFRLKSVRLAVSLSITILGSCVLVIYTLLIFVSMFLK